MSWVVIARKNVYDGIRDGTLVYNGLFLSLLGLVVSYNHARVRGGSTLTIDLATLMTIVVPLSAVMVAHESVAYERATWRIRTTLSLPHTRGEILFGMAIGRAVIMVLAVSVALTLAAVLTLFLGASLIPRAFLGYGVATLLLAGAVATMGVGFSAAVRSTTLSLIAGMLTVLGALAWPALLSLTWSVLIGGAFPDWLITIGGWDPIRGYAKIAVLLAGRDLGSLGTHATWYGFVVLGGWTLLIVSGGYLQFRRVDL